jgi:E3 ubiquitin-protein ligase RNF144
MDSNKKFCPTPNCKSIVDLPLIGSKTQCPNCKKYFCKNCGLHWHKGMKCQEAEDEIYA